MERLHLTDRGSIERWHTIFEAQGRMNNTGVRKAFARLYETHVVPDLKTMGDIVSCMRHCPFVNASAFKKPDRIVKPEGLSNLSEEHQALIARWVDEAVGSSCIPSETGPAARKRSQKAARALKPSRCNA